VTTLPVIRGMIVYVRYAIAALGVGVVLLVVLVYAWALVVFGLPGRPILWEVPAGFRGWASVKYEEPQCERLRTRGLFLVLSALRDGLGCTSSQSPARASRYYRLEFVAPDGTRTRGTISDHHYYDADYLEEYLFVGTDEEERRDPALRLRRPAKFR
jgi:hypothetical protein